MFRFLFPLFIFRFFCTYFLTRIYLNHEISYEMFLSGGTHSGSKFASLVSRYAERAPILAQIHRVIRLLVAPILQFTLVTSHKVTRSDSPAARMTAVFDAV